MSKEQTDLLPCAHCGCDDIGTESTATDGSVWCRGCAARITKRHWPRDDRGQTDAIAAWNRRATPSAQEQTDWIEGAIARAFRRGFEWRGENPDAAAYLNKASADHADAAMTALKSGAPDA